MDLNAARGAELWEGTARLSGAVPYVGDERFGWRVMRVLVVEDEMPLADAIARGLQRHGMDVDVAYDGDDGYAKIRSLGYDVVVRDRDLPGRTGDEICRSVAGAGMATRVLMLTASGSDDDRALGLVPGRLGLHEQAVSVPRTRAPSPRLR